ncbi:winged helix-turn-helix transcriptional regulator [Fundicoccus culcitae]|uniref:Helix-turn-helix transcriptional regulator n=1 Tax=Fundicoccus culcitae TaxID=2969821 RepID=A0ABY5P7L5_9LACT|nr:helix-turn-helix domain-containing protein [Fundicoccus culcitae]UUX34722.1 helix-turn-helix transcriptional regulator [Fundicoccus culcitae]
MYEAKIKKEIRCPLEYGLDVFGGKWKARIICMLNQKTVLRYNELKEEMIDITDAVLSKALKELMEDNIVGREQFNEIPVRVEYSLTPKGLSVIPILEQICHWSEKYVTEELMPFNFFEGYFDEEK